MHLRVPRPLPERLPIKPKDDPSGAEEEDQTHVRHDWRDVTTFDDPRRDEFREAISPHVLVDGYSDEDGACYGLVGIDGIG